MAREKKGRSWWKTRTALIWSVGSLMTMLFLLLFLTQPAFLVSLTNKYYDASLIWPEHRPSLTDRNTPLIVDIDESSLAQFGQWPWPRYRVARLLEQIAAANPAVIALDQIFAEPDRTSLVMIRDDLKQEWNLTLPLETIPIHLRDNDLFLAQALSAGPFVMAYRLTFNSQVPSAKECWLHPLKLAFHGDANIDSDLSAPFYTATGVVCNLDIFSRASLSSGFINVVADRDGVLRRTPLILTYEGRHFPSLALAAFMISSGVAEGILKTSVGGAVSLRLGDNVIPLDARGNILINYRGPGKTFPYVSAADILQNRIAPEVIKNRIVFLGSTAMGINDYHPAPGDPVFPGVEIHATVVDNLFRQDYLARPYWTPAAEFILILLVGLLSTLLMQKARASVSLLFVVGAILILWSGSQLILHREGIFLSPLLPLGTVGGNFALMSVLKYWWEETQKKAKMRELLLTQDFTIRCLSSLTECRNAETGGHILRTQAYVAAIGDQLSRNPKYAAVLDPETREQLQKSAPLHDIGKVGLSDNILLKPGKLTEEEFEEMKKHTTSGCLAIEKAEQKATGAESEKFMRLAKEMSHFHHEKWDGTGYPGGLSGENIPLSGRIMALADVYDALISPRVYKQAFPHEVARSLIVELRGKHFDPDVVAAFLAVEEEFMRIAREIKDH